jgi:hypothetical protein
VNKKIDRITVGLLCLEILTQVAPAWADPAVAVPSQVGTDNQTLLPPEPTSSIAQSNRPGLKAQHNIAPPEIFMAQSIPASIDEPGIPDTTELEAEPLDQVTSVSELADVQPSDWAYEALKSLVERYGVIDGYSDGTFRGNRPLSRYEFAATVDAVLAKIEELSNTTQNRRSLQEDLLTLQRLQTFYRAALGDLNTRLDGIEDRITTQEDQIFSTTTKLQGQTVLAYTGGTDATNTVVTRTRLTLTTNFAPSDRLVTLLELGNNGLDAINSAQSETENLLGTTGLLADGGGLDYVSISEDVRLYRLYYSFRPIPELSVAVGPRIVPSDFVDRNSFANDSATNFGSSFFANNPFIIQNQIDRLGGAGIALTWKPNEIPLTLRALYAAADAGSPDLPNIRGGLFGDRHQGVIEAEYAFSKTLIARLQFTTAEINGVDIDAVGLNVEWAVNPILGVFGRFGFGAYDGFNVLLNRDLDLSPKTWAVGVQARNFLIPGTLAGFAIGQPFVESDLGDATQTNLEAFISIDVNDNISVSPSVMLVTNPNNEDSNASVWQGTVRTVFSF